MSAEERLRFGDYLQEVGVRHQRVSYGDLQSGAPATGRIRPKPGEVATILKPYVAPRFLQQFRSVVPLALYLAGFQLLVLGQPVGGGARLVVALGGLVIGLMMFMEGIKLGLMPLGARVGETLPTRSPLPVVLGVAFVLGVGLTFAEPAVGALQAAGALVSPADAPLLYDLLGRRGWALVLAVGAGVGLATALGTLRFVFSWSLKPLIYLSLLPCLALTAYAYTRPDLRQIVGMAWDAGAVATGPVTVPLVLALGIGVSQAVGRGGGSLAGFGIVTLASVLPVLMVLALGVAVAELGVAPAAPIAAAAAPGWWARSPWEEIIGAFRAIVPLVAFLLLILRHLARKDIAHKWVVAYGITLALGGMILFNVGLSFGLAELGSQSGSALPAAFTRVATVPDSPLYVYALGIGLVVAFAWLLGFGATLAEPALNALGITVEEVTNGAFTRRLLMTAVAIGVACGIALGIVKLVYGLDMTRLLLPAYAVLLVLTFLSTEEFVNVAWDSAGVTTGPVTVPLVFAMGLALGEAVDAADGFGVLSLAFVCPVASVLLCGLYIRWNTWRRNPT